MDEHYTKLAVRVQKIGIIDLFLTACLFAEILPKSLHLFKLYAFHLYKIHYATDDTASPNGDLDSTGEIIEDGEDEHEVDKSVYREPIDKVNLEFWWVFKEVFFVAGLLIVFVAALGLIKATNLQILNTPKAAQLARNWLLSNILVVLIITVLIIVNLPDYPGGEGMEVAFTGCSVYLFGRGVASYSVWKFMLEVNNTVRANNDRQLNAVHVATNTNTNGSAVIIPNTTG